MLSIKKNNTRTLSNSGITLIALIITIIILIILAGVAINLTLGKNGIFNKAKLAKDEYSKSQAKEELELIIADLKMEIYNNENRNATLEDFKNVINQNEKIVLKSEKYDENDKLIFIEIVYEPEYTFGIDKDLNIIDNYSNEEEKDKDIFVEYKAQNVQEKEMPIKIIDKTQKSSDAELSNAKYGENGKGIVFDGSTTYGVLDSDKINLSCPTTITVAVKWENGSNNLLFIDAKSKIAIGSWNNELLLTVGEVNKSYAYRVPTDFFKNEINYITVQFSQSVTDNTVYINGEKMNKSSYYGAWNKNESGTYLGRRAAGSYFKGILYDFKIYNKLFTEQEIIERYQKEKADFENNTKTANEHSESLILDYICNKGENNEQIYLDSIKDTINNKYEIKLKDVEYNNTKNGLVFNGTSSYGIFDDSIFKISFPNTITIIAKCNKAENRVLFTDKSSKIGIGLWQSKYIILENDTLSNAIYYDIESEFLLQEINYITVVYGNDTSQNALYLNGKKIDNTSNGNGWNSSESGTWLGRRNSGSYFDGTLYNFKIYSKALLETEIMNEYQKDKEYYSLNN